MTPRRLSISIIIAVPALLLAGSLSACDDSKSENHKVIVLGFDGMDPRLCERLMDAGKLPALAKMRDAGGYSPLGTSIPPQSPVAWSNFITGANPGVHGIFDFIHRDPAKQCAPYYSAADTLESDDGWEIEDFKIPLTFWPFNHSPTQTLLRRKGTPFWEYLDRAGVPIRIYDIPANYPPDKSKHGHMCCLSGMGVPDLLGGFGTYQYFSEDVLVPKQEGGGNKSPLRFTGNSATASLTGPYHTYAKRPFRTEVKFDIHRHPSQATARIDIQGETVLLKEGEWSDWTKVTYTLEMPPFLPDAKANGICRFYLQQVHPAFKLYVTPINIDPSDPAGQKVSEPESFVTDISDELGLFYTSGFQEDHKALSNKVFNDEEYLEQVRFVLAERIRLLGYATEHYEDGLLFFYFSSTDLQAHMFWWDSQEPHPLRSAAEARKYNQVIEDLYVEMDSVVGGVVKKYGEEATILVMSDHGFCNFRRQFNINTWLRDNGYINPPTCKSILDPRQGRLNDWKKTKAYALGLNGLYVNLKGRERDGIVNPSERDALLKELIDKLLAVRDPADGKPVFAEVYRTDEVYSGPEVSKAPDLIIGYHRGYRTSWAATLGDMTEEVFTDNTHAWSADHCIAAKEVPGVIFSNRPIRRAEPSLVDLAPTILEEFNVQPPDTMTGGNLFRSHSASGLESEDGTNAKGREVALSEHG